MYTQNNYFLTRRPMVRNFAVPAYGSGETRVVVYSPGSNKRAVAAPVPVSGGSGIIPMVLGAGAGTAAAIPAANWLAPRTVDFLTQSSIGNHGPFMKTVANVLNSALQGGKAPVDLSWSGKTAAAANAAANELNGVSQKVAGHFQGVSEQPFADLSNAMAATNNAVANGMSTVGDRVRDFYNLVANAPAGLRLAKFNDNIGSLFKPGDLAAVHDGAVKAVGDIAGGVKGVVTESAAPVKAATADVLNAGEKAAAAGTHALTNNPFDLAGSAISYGLPVAAGIAGAYAANKIAKAMQNSVAARQAAAARAAAGAA